ncbi:MAG TPA: sigma 54-interacting transcriptional regulator [Tissierellaceae bacterium]|nr:sigma 54-interacting transcriptional regulator [Tissierellaceae bacterium]
MKYFNDEFLTDFFNSIDIGIHILNFEGTTVLYNKSCERIEGIDSRWIIGKNMKTLVDDGVYSDSIGLKVIEEEKKMGIAQRVNDRHIYSTGIPIFKEKTLVYVVINVVDMTNIMKLRERIKELQSINRKISNELTTLKVMDGEIISKSKKMEEIKHLALRIGRVDSNILIEGESGVGKGILSRYIHENSNRKSKPFIKVDCGSLSPALIESELFGYEEGAFTGAKRGGKVGLIEAANGGTLLLDEVGELPLSLQVKLLSVIQEKKIRQLGSVKDVNLDIRIIAITNRNLKKMVEEKKFRVDLYYRLKVIYIKIPPLRERREDIVPLIHLFLEKLNKKYGFNKEISGEAMKLLINHPWPGNVREVENEIERLVVTSSSDIIDKDNIPQGEVENYSLYDLNEERNFKDHVYEYEKVLIRKYLERSQDIHELSEKTGLENSTLRKKAKRLGIELDYGGNNS